MPTIDEDLDFLSSRNNTWPDRQKAITRIRGALAELPHLEEGARLLGPGPTHPVDEYLARLEIWRKAERLRQSGKGER